MEFRLTKEEKNYIVSEYGGSVRNVSVIEKKLNSLDLITDKDDFIELVMAVVAQHETIKKDVDFKSTKEELNKHFLSINQIIYYEIIRKYLDFDKFENGTEEKIQKILQLQ